MDHDITHLNAARRRILVSVAGIVVFAAIIALAIAVSDDTTAVVAAEGDDAADSTPTTPKVPDATLTTSTPPDATLPDPTLSDPLPLTNPGSTGPDTTPSTTSSSDGVPTELEGRLVAELLNGVRLVRYAEPTDTDCAAGTLVAEVDGSIVTTYDLPFAGGIRAVPSSYGPTALIGSCEEWITWVAFYDEPTDPSSAPAISAHPLPDDVFFLWDFSWVGLTGYLGASASFSDGASPATTASVVIDAADGSIELADDVFGPRSPRSSDGFDLLIPDGWVLTESAEPGIEIRLPESGSRLRVGAEPPTADVGAAARENEIVDSVVDIDVTIWGEADGVSPSTWASGTDTRFASPTSTRYVREIELEDRFVTIEAEVANGASRGEVLFVLYLLDQVRIFDTVG